MNRCFPNRIRPGPKLRRGLRVFYVLCGLALALDFFPLRHAANGIEAAWGFYALYGFGACVALVLAAIWMRHIVQRDEDYYERDPGEHQTSKPPLRTPEPNND